MFHGENGGESLVGPSIGSAASGGPTPSPWRNELKLDDPSVVVVGSAAREPDGDVDTLLTVGREGEEGERKSGRGDMARIGSELGTSSGITRDGWVSGCQLGTLGRRGGLAACWTRSLWTEAMLRSF